MLSFHVTEIGTRGVLNVTIPKSAVPPQSSVTVLVDSIPTGGTELQDARNYYVFLAIPYGTHSIQLQFIAPQPPYLVYVAIGALTSGMIGVLFLFRNWRKSKLPEKLGDFKP